MTRETEPPVTLDTCAQEPIHIPGSIQPHGVLFACAGERLVVQQVSQSVADHLGVTVESMLGRSLLDVVGDPGPLARAGASPETARELYPLVVSIGTRRFDTMVHRSVTGPTIVEIEPHRPGDAQDHRLRASIVRLQNARDIETLSNLAAEQVRELTGFDRVMVYRFDEEWNGEVVAERKRDDLEPFLGQHYPASDIPAQARRLYTVNLLRFIGDVAYRPSPLVPRFDPGTQAPLDLGFAHLRSVSPIHIEYLQNMGVTASMSVSLVVDGVLAGLIACHHYSGPHLVPYRVRDTVEFLGQALAWQLRILETAAAAERAREIKVHEAELVRGVASTPSLLDGLTTSALLALVEADGAAVILEEGTRTLGHVPDAAALATLRAQLVASEREVIATDRPMPELPGVSEAHPGVLAVAISRALGEYIVWFRKPTEQTVDWAGDPRKVTIVSDDGAPPRLSPRGSFALWREVVRGRSLPWQPWHVNAASNLRRALLGGVRLRASELRSLNERLLEADRAKDDFIAVVSHELRTPLNSILGYQQLLGTGTGSKDQVAKGLDVIGRNARTLAELVDDLLDVSRMVSGKVALDLQGVDFVGLVDSVLESVVLATQAKQLRLVKQLDPTATPVLGDATRLRQVVTNLLSNAVKFTPVGGTITVSLRRIDADVELAISDTGEGIDPEMLPLVFDMFRQGDSGMSRRARGLGIGLALARRIVELHGGHVKAQSPGPGRGSTFRVSLPRATIRPEAAKASDPSSGTRLANVRVLIVDDDDDSRELLGIVLAHEGAVTELASSATEALEILRVRTFDVVVSDVGMPDMDGLTLLRTLRQRPAEQGGRVPAIALTAYNRTTDRASTSHAGFDAHVPKPVDTAAIVSVIADLARR